MTSSNRVPAALQAKFDTIALATDAFCDQHLNDDTSWAAGAVHALGMVNFLFDPSQTPHCAYFSDRGRLFQTDRGRCFSAIVDAQGGAQAKN